MVDYEEARRVSIMMCRYGGSFVSSLGNALMHADAQNRQKIYDTWPEYWKEYLDMYNPEEGRY